MNTQTIEVSTVTVRCDRGVATVFVYRDLGDILLVCRPEGNEAAVLGSREPVTVGSKRDSLVE